MKTVYVLLWGGHWELEVRGVTTNLKVAELWESRHPEGLYSYEKATLVDTVKEYARSDI